MTTEEMNEQAMEIIVKAGNGRTLLNKALEALYEGDEEVCNSHMEEAKKEMIAAHAAQTKVLQSTITDEEAKPNILFTHAQDTLMTIMSEMNIAKHLTKIVRMIKEIK